MPNFESYCRCPGCGECSAHKQVPELEAKIRSLTAKKERLKAERDEAVKAEREACARVCEQPSDEIQITDDISQRIYKDAFDCAAAIRARGEVPR